jgi:hypothetical protein
LTGFDFSCPDEIAHDKRDQTADGEGGNQHSVGHYYRSVGRHKQDGRPVMGAV